jgi:hypothetical protein
MRQLSSRPLTRNASGVFYDYAGRRTQLNGHTFNRAVFASDSGVIVNTMGASNNDRSASGLNIDSLFEFSATPTCDST